MTIPHPTALTSIQSSLQHFMPSPALASTVNTSAFEPNMSPALFVTSLGQFLSDSQHQQLQQHQQHQHQQHHLKDKQTSPNGDPISTSNPYYQLST